MSAGIDAVVVLGLAGKAVQVFARPGHYLSFAIAPYAMERARLKALISDPLSAEGQSGLAEFSLVVNEVPTGGLWQWEGKRLWNVYGDVLAGADLAETLLTLSERSDYERAFELLYDVTAEGAPKPAAITVAYEQYRDAYYAAAQEYKNREQQAESLADSAVRERWAADKPQLLERVTTAELGWATAGHRAEVDEARRLLRDLGSRSPLVVWAGYRRLFDPNLPELYFRTAPDGSLYLPTGYLPGDIVDSGWSTITVTKGELAALAAAAPEDLRARLGAGIATTTVERVSFEYSAVTISRPWFAPQVLESRAWRFHEPGRFLSDGAEPPSGECTAYVTGLVLARNITVSQRTAAEASPDLGFLPTAKKASRASMIPAEPPELVVARAEARRRMLASRAALAPAPATAPASATVVRAGPSIALRARPHLAVARAAVVGAAAREVVPPASPPPAPPPPPVHLPALMAIPSLRHPVVVPAPPPQPTSVVNTTTEPDDVYVLAFICRLLGKSPDPDPALSW